MDSDSNLMMARAVVQAARRLIVLKRLLIPELRRRLMSRGDRRVAIPSLAQRYAVEGTHKSRWLRADPSSKVRQSHHWTQFHRPKEDGILECRRQSPSPCHYGHPSKTSIFHQVFDRSLGVQPCPLARSIEIPNCTVQICWVAILSCISLSMAQHSQLLNINGHCQSSPDIPSWPMR